MALTAWLAYSFIAVLLIGATMIHYRRREPSGRGRMALGLLRGFSLALVVLLLFDPVLPAGPRARPTVVALVDASLSMSMPGPEGTGWEQAWTLVEALRPTRVRLFGSDGPALAEPRDDAGPDGVRSDLAPALRAAVEAGADRVVVVTDGAIEDPGAVRAVAAAAGVPVEVRRTRPASANLALGSVEAPSWVEPRSRIVVRVSVDRGPGPGPVPDSVTVTLGVGGVEVGRARAVMPSPGRAVSLGVPWRPGAAGGTPVRLDVAIEPGDGVPDDDRRSVYLRVAPEPAGVALVSFRPDQEPRFLVPVLARALGVPVRGWLRLPGDRYIAVGSGLEAGTSVGEAAVRAAVADAGLVVLHGVETDAPGWAGPVLEGARRLLVFPAGPVPGLPVPTGPLREGDWYVDPDVPASPVAGLLAGLETSDLPPLSGLRPVRVPAGFWAPLRGRLARRGDAVPLAVAGRTGDRRVVVAPGEGYWRWSFAGPDGRAAYERLWAALAAWLLEDPGDGPPDQVRPAASVVRRGEPVRWTLPAGLDTVTIETDAGGVDTVTSDRPDTGPLPPGEYRYRARAGSRDVGEGGFTVESYSPEFTRPPVALALDSGDPSGRRTPGPGRNRPLRTTPWPWLLLAALLAGEWILRRRWGLR
jgi:hypothetical protein